MRCTFTGYGDSFLSEINVVALDTLDISQGLLYGVDALGVSCDRSIRGTVSGHTF